MNVQLSCPLSSTTTRTPPARSRSRVPFTLKRPAHVSYVQSAHTIVSVVELPAPLIAPCARTTGGTTCRSNSAALVGAGGVTVFIGAAAALTAVAVGVGCDGVGGGVGEP